MNQAPPDLSTGQLLQLLHDLPLGVALEDDAGVIVWANHRLLALLGREASGVLGHALSELPLQRGEHDTDEGQLFQVAGAPEEGPQWLICQEGPGLGPGIHAVYVVDATELEQARIKVDRLTQALRGQISTDNATGLLNRRAVLSQLEAQVSRSRRYHNLLSVLVMELICTTGEAASQQRVDLTQSMVLAVSRMLRDQTRWPDIIGRWDEMRFLLVLPETSAASAAVLRDKILDQLEQLPAVNGQEGTRCEARCGIAEWKKGDLAMTLLERAEHELPPAGE